MSNAATRPAPFQSGFRCNRFPARKAEDIQVGDVVMMGSEYTTVSKVVVSDRTASIWHGYAGCKPFFYVAKRDDVVRVED